MLLVLTAITAASAGCGGSGGEVRKKQSSHVRLLTNLHMMATSKLKHPPHDEKEFKQAIAGLQVSPEKLKVASIDEVFVSERDGQPLVVAYGSLPKGSDVVVYEQTGVGGKRLVGHKIGMIEEVDETTFNDLVASKK